MERSTPNLMNSDYLNAEYGVIGSLLIDAPLALPAVTDMLAPDDFTVELNREIYKTVLAMQANSENIDPITVIRRLGDMPELRRYVAECIDATSTAANAGAYAEVVKSAAMLRMIRDVTEQTREMAGSGADYREVLGFASDKFAAMTENSGGNDLVGGTEAMNDFYDYREKFDKNPESMFVKTGFENLDFILGGGFVNQGLYVLAARPGIGKTTLALNIADNIAATGKPVLFISLEMSVKQITAKRIARNTGISYNTLLMGHLSVEDYTKMAKASADMSKLPVTVNRKAGATVPQIESMARKVKGLRLVIVDYMGLIRPADKRGKRYEEISDISASLKSLANRLNIPVLCLCQLNRESENEKGKRPRLYHLRDSGAIEQDADGVMLLHKAESADEDSKEWEGQECTCYIDKNRHGNTGVAKFSFYGAASKLVPVRERSY
jgi:replicative DNA helicase